MVTTLAAIKIPGGNPTLNMNTTAHAASDFKCIHTQTIQVYIQFVANVSLLHRGIVRAI